jgi:hypothetical protein
VIAQPLRPGLNPARITPTRSPDWRNTLHGGRASSSPRRPGRKLAERFVFADLRCRVRIHVVKLHRDERV